MPDLVPDIRVANYALTVDGEALDSQTTSPELFGALLGMGRTAILAGIEELYQNQVANHRGSGIVIPPPISALNLGTIDDTKKVLTPSGIANPTSIHTNRVELKKSYHPYWQAVADAGFIPEVRSRRIDRQADIGRNAIALTLRAHNKDTSFNPEYDPSYFTDVYPCYASPRSTFSTVGEVDVCFAHSSGGEIEHTVPLAAIDATASVRDLVSKLPELPKLANLLFFANPALAVHCKFVGTHPKTGDLAIEVPAMPHEGGKAFMYLPQIKDSY